MPVYKRAKRVSIFLSTETEVNTIDILRQMFRDMKEVSNFLSSNRISRSHLPFPFKHEHFPLIATLTSPYIIAKLNFPFFIQVFVPTYKEDIMEMVRLYNMDDYHSLQLTKWNIKQPSLSDNRENPMLTCKYYFSIK